MLATERDGTIFDSETNNIYFETATGDVSTLDLLTYCQVMYALISPAIKPFAAEPGAYGIPCSEIHKLSAEIDIAFNGTDGLPFNLTVPSSELSVGPFESNTSMCQMLIDVSDEFEGFGLVGGSLLKHHYSIWDLGNQQMGCREGPGVKSLRSSAGRYWQVIATDTRAIAGSTFNSFDCYVCTLGKHAIHFSTALWLPR